MEEEAKWESQFEKDMADWEERLLGNVDLPEDLPELIPQQDEPQEEGTGKFSFFHLKN